MEGLYFHFKLGLYTEPPHNVQSKVLVQQLKIYTGDTASLQQSLDFHVDITRNVMLRHYPDGECSVLESAKASVCLWDPWETTGKVCTPSKIPQ